MVTLLLEEGARRHYPAFLLCRYPDESQDWWGAGERFWRNRCRFAPPDELEDAYEALFFEPPLKETLACQPKGATE